MEEVLRIVFGEQEEQVVGQEEPVVIVEEVMASTEVTTTTTIVAVRVAVKIEAELEAVEEVVEVEAELADNEDIRAWMTWEQQETAVTSEEIQAMTTMFLLGLEDTRQHFHLLEGETALAMAG